MRTSFWSFIGKSSLHLLLLIIKAILQWPKIVCWVLSSIQKWTSKICGLFKFFKFWELSWKSYFKIRDLYQIACNKLMLTTAPWQTNQSSNPYLERTSERKWKYLAGDDTRLSDSWCPLADSAERKAMWEIELFSCGLLCQMVQKILQWRDRAEGHMCPLAEPSWELFWL
jgi:hypothetical protein